MRPFRDKAAIVALAMAMAAIPCLVLAPVLTGMTIFHDHGDGLHSHRFDEIQDPVAAHHAAHLEDDAERGCDEVGGFASIRPTDSDDDYPSIFILVPSIVVGSLREAQQTAPGTLLIPQPPVEPLVFRPVAVDLAPSVAARERGRVPTRHGIAEVLLTSHAILI